MQTLLSVWGDLESFDKKMCPVTRFFSLWRLTWVFDGTWKKFHKSLPSHTFFRCGDYLKFLRGLGKFRQKDVPSYTFFFAVETNLSFWRDLEKFSQKSVTSHTFLRCGDYLEFLMGIGKFRQKDVTSYTFSFLVQTILNFWWVLESFDKKAGQLHVFSLWRLS